MIQKIYKLFGGSALYFNKIECFRPLIFDLIRNFFCLSSHFVLYRNTFETRVISVKHDYIWSFKYCSNGHKYCALMYFSSMLIRVHEHYCINVSNNPISSDKSYF